MDEAFGHLYGRVDLKGRGTSVAKMLGTSSGTAVIAANGGQVSEAASRGSSRSTSRRRRCCSARTSRPSFAAPWATSR